jgi:Chaperone of endosialidase
MSKYISGIKGSTFSIDKGGVVSTATGTAVLNSVAGVYTGIDTAGNTGIELNASSSTMLSYVDFTRTNVDFNGRIIYTHSTHNMGFWVNGAAVMNINTNGHMTLNNGSIMYVTNIDSNTGNMAIGYNTAKQTGPILPLVIYNNATDRTVLASFISAGTSSGSNAITFNAPLTVNSTVTMGNINSNLLLVSNTNATENTISTSTTNSGTSILNLTQPSLVASGVTLMRLGTLLSTNNSAELSFTNVGAGSASNMFRIGFYNSGAGYYTLTADGVHTFGGTTLNCPAFNCTTINSNLLLVSNTTANENTISTSTTNSGTSILNLTQPSLVASGVTLMRLGTALSANNSAELSFTNIGAGSASNIFRIGFYNSGAGYYTLTAAGVHTFGGTTLNCPAINSGVLTCNTLTGVSSGGNSLSITAVNNAPIILDLLAPNLATSNMAQVRVGVAASTNNVAEMQFYYAGSGSTSNYYSLGFYGGARFYTLTAAGVHTFGGTTLNCPAINSLSGATSSIITTYIGNNSILNMFAPNITNGYSALMRIGVAESGNNSIEMVYNYIGSGSTSNYYSLGFYGGTRFYTLTAAGVHTFNGAANFTNIITANAGINIASGQTLNVGTSGSSSVLNVYGGINVAAINCYAINTNNNTITTGTGVINSGTINVAGKINITGTDASIDLIASNSSQFTYVDFGRTGLDYAGRIIYNNANNSMNFYTNASTAVAVVIDSAGTLNAGIVSCLAINSNNNTISSGSGAMTSGSITTSLITCNGALNSGSISCTSINTNNNNVVLGSGVLSANGLVTNSLDTQRGAITCGTINSYAITCTGVNTSGLILATGGGSSTYTTSATYYSNAGQVVSSRTFTTETFSGEFHNYIVVQAGVFVNSDARIKENIMPIKNECDILNKLKPCTYTYIDKTKNINGKKRYGLIAQEVEEIFPDAVTIRSNALPNIMKIAEVISNNSFRLDMDIHIGKIRLYSSGVSEEKLIDCNIISRNGDIYTVDAIIGNKVFIYGEFVDDFKGVEYNAFIPLLLAGYQSQFFALITQESRIKALEDKIELLIHAQKK